jgi:hypothetical protein
VDGNARCRNGLILRLPTSALARLQRLQLATIQPILSAPGSSSSRQAPLLPALRSVKLLSCEAAAASLALQRAQLTELELQAVTITASDAVAGSEAVAALLQAQPRLSVLGLRDITPALTDAALAPLSTMQQLQELSIDSSLYGDVSPYGVISLCSHLTSLSLSLHLSARLTVSPPPQWPPCLVHLRLTWIQVEPAVLGGLTQLEQLDLSHCTARQPIGHLYGR